MDNSEKKYDSLGCILASAMLLALINKDFSTFDKQKANTDFSKIKEDKACHDSCQNNCKSCSESKVKLDMELIKSKYEEVKKIFYSTKNPATKTRLAYIRFMELGEVLGIEKGK